MCEIFIDHRNYYSTEDECEDGTSSQDCHACWHLREKNQKMNDVLYRIICSAANLARLQFWYKYGNIGHIWTAYWNIQNTAKIIKYSTEHKLHTSVLRCPSLLETFAFSISGLLWRFQVETNRKFYFDKIILKILCLIAQWITIFSPPFYN